MPRPPSGAPETWEEVGKVNTLPELFPSMLIIPAVLLVDPPVTEILAGKHEDTRKVNLEQEPFQGGYPDPIQYESLAEALAKPDPPRTSMADDLMHFFIHHYATRNLRCPTSTTYFLRSIAARHYLQVYNYTQGLLDQLEYQLDRRKNFAIDKPEDTLQVFWSDLHHFQRRMEYYRRHLA